MTVSNRFGVLDTLEDPEELWDNFRYETLEAAKECIGECPRSWSGFTSVETLNRIEEIRIARLAVDHDQYRALSRRTRIFLRRNNDRYLSDVAEDIECHLNATDLRPAYRALKKLPSKFTFQVSAIRTEDGCLVSDADGQKLVGLSTLSSCSRWIREADSRLQGCRCWMLIHPLTILHPLLTMSKRLWPS